MEAIIDKETDLGFRKEHEESASRMEETESHHEEEPPVIDSQSPADALQSFLENIVRYFINIFLVIT